MTTTTILLCLVSLMFLVSLTFDIINYRRATSWHSRDHYRNNLIADGAIAVFLLILAFL